MPPNGVRRSRRNQQFTQVIPTRSFSATRWPRFRFVVQTERCQAVLRVVGLGDGFFFGVERRDVAHGTEDFFLHAARGFRQPGENRGLDVEAIVASRR